MKKKKNLPVLRREIDRALLRLHTKTVALNTFETGNKKRKL